MDDATGVIHAYINNKLYDINVTNGRAYLNVSDLSIGSYYGFVCMMVTVTMRDHIIHITSK